MWKCDNCGAEITKEKYKHCWNCGKPRQNAEENQQSDEPAQTKVEPIIKLKNAVVIEPLAKYVVPQPVQPQQNIETPNVVETPKSDADAERKNHENLTDPEPQTEKVQQRGDNFLSQYESTPVEKSSSIIGKIIPVLIWLSAVSAIGYFAYLSYQKTTNFDQQIAGDFQKINDQRSQFVFPPLPPMRRGTVIEGSLKPKVLPVKTKSNEVDPLFSYLPDDLRPSNLEEVKTMMWIDCQNNPVGKYRDGTIGYQEKCTVYLVDRENSKFIGIEDFLGVMPALAKEREGEDALGKVFPEKYVAYLREKQPENERGTIQNSSESPNHHYYSKSEFILALLLLGLLTAVGLGWLAFNLRFNKKG